MINQNERVASCCYFLRYWNDFRKVGNICIRESLCNLEESFFHIEYVRISTKYQETETIAKESYFSHEQLIFVRYLKERLRYTEAIADANRRHVLIH